MKSNPMFHRIIAGIGLSSLLASRHLVHGQSIPEPGLVLYGRIVNTQPNFTSRLTFGTLRWTIQPPTGATITVTATITNINDQFSYVARVPFESPLAGFTISANTLTLGSTPVSYTRTATVSATAQGTQQTATILNPAIGSFSFGQADRGRMERVDLQVSLGFVDTDGNGLDDNWEIAYFGHIGVDPNADPDGDGLSNLGEFKSGTNPTDAQSRFAFINVQRGNPGVSIQWSSAPSIKYTLERSQNITTGFAPILSNINATPTVNTYQDTTATGPGNYFYRLRVQ